MNSVSSDPASFEELSKLSRQFKAILENSPDGVVMVSSSGKMIYASPSARRMFGFSESEELGFDPASYTHPEDLPMVLTEIQKTLTQPEYLSTIQYRFLNKSGEWKWIESVISNQLSVPDVEALVINFRDIHDKMMVLEDLKAAKEAAELANRVKDSFLASISHEIRTPLNGIMGMLSIIADSLDEASLLELNPFFESIDRSSKRLISTFEDIINFSLLHTNQPSLINSEFELNDLIKGILEDLSPLAAESNNEIVFESMSGQIKIFSDLTAWRTILRKLIGNAIKFTSNGKINIEVKADTDPRFRILKISDTGVGISEEYLKDLFKPFSQEETGYGRTFEGLGLGLPIVKKYIDLTGSEIGVQSVKNQGTTFTVRINAGIA